MLSWLLAGCTSRPASPRIVCEINGKLVPTAFTFEQFAQTVKREHGHVEVQNNSAVRSRSVEVFFKDLGDGRLLAERVLLVPSLETMEPAAFFGLTNVQLVITADIPLK